MEKEEGMVLREGEERRKREVMACRTRGQPSGKSSAMPIEKGVDDKG